MSKKELQLLHRELADKVLVVVEVASVGCRSRTPIAGVFELHPRGHVAKERCFEQEPYAGSGKFLYGI